MRSLRARVEISDMETGRRRFRRAEQTEATRRGLRDETLALQQELELLDEVLRSRPTPLSARASLDRALFSVRTAERAWCESRAPCDLLSVVEQLDAARAALDASLEALRRRAARAGR